MALTFPSSPTNGQIYVDSITGYRYIYNSNTSAWGFSSNNVGMSVSSTPPSNVGSGSMWYNREIGRTFVYYNDGDSSQWVETVPAGSIDTTTIASYVNPIYASLNTNWSFTNTAYTFANIAVNTANTAFPNTPNVSFNGSFNVPNGAVSIGTNSFPTGKFQVSTANGEISRFTATGASGGYHVSFFDNSTPWYFGSAKATIAGNINDLYFGSGAGTTNNLIFGTAGTERVRIDPTGNVTTSANLAVSGSLTTSSRGIVKSSLPAGSILQVVQTVKTDVWSASPASTTYAVVTGLSVNITPTSSTSKILVMLNMWIGQQGYLFKGLVKRNGNIIVQGDTYGSRPRTSFAGGPYAGGTNEAYSMSQVAFTYLDSPATTTSCTNTVEAANYTTYAIYVNRSHQWQNTTDYDGVPVSTITVFEIAQ